VFRYFIYFALIAQLFSLPNPAFAYNRDFYCYDFYHKYRAIKYWARKYISVSDYNSKTGDSRYLKLTYKIPKKKVGEETNKEIVAHFYKEFKRLIKGNLPFHDIDEGRDDRFAGLYKKYGKSENFLEILHAQEEARRNSLYGPNPGAVYCIIKIEKREFPVLYEMECSIGANKDLANINGLLT